jgi:hypothetical protein
LNGTWNGGEDKAIIRLLTPHEVFFVGKGRNPPEIVLVPAISVAHLRFVTPSKVASPKDGWQVDKSEMGDGDGWHEDDFWRVSTLSHEKHLMMRC